MPNATCPSVFRPWTLRTGWATLWRKWFQTLLDRRPWKCYRRFGPGWCNAGRPGTQKQDRLKTRLTSRPDKRNLIFIVSLFLMLAPLRCIFYYSHIGRGGPGSSIDRASVDRVAVIAPLLVIFVNNLNKFLGVPSPGQPRLLSFNKGSNIKKCIHIIFSCRGRLVQR